MKLHSDSVSAYYVHDNLGVLTMPELNIIMVYGIGSFILIFLPVFVISMYEAKQVKQAQHGGIEALVNGIAKTFIYSVMILFLVMLILMALIGMSTSTINPAFGIEWFFHTEWLDPSLMATIDVTKIGGASKLESAQSMVAILTFSRFIYILLMMFWFLIFVGYAGSTVISNHRKTQDGNVLSLLAGMGIGVAMSILVFWGLVGLISEVLWSLISFSDTIQSTSYGAGTPLRFNVTNDLVALFNVGKVYFETNIMLP